MKLTGNGFEVVVPMESSLSGVNLQAIPPELYCCHNSLTKPLFIKNLNFSLF